MKKQHIYLLLMGILCISAFPAKAQAAATYRDGIYEGLGNGYRGNVKINVTITDGKITAIEEVSQNETPEYWTAAKSVFSSIVEQQSIDVDSVSGATKSSDGIKSAVKDALSKAATVDQSIPDASIFASGTGTKENPFVINNTAQFEAFGKSVSGMIDYTGYYIRLNQDIDISGIEWNPIGADKTAFNGTLNGGGHSIKGLTMGTVSNERTLSADLGQFGLFGKLGGQAVIQNLSLTDVSIHVYHPGLLHIGALAGSTLAGTTDRNGTRIDGCHVDGSLTVRNGSGNIWAGGIVGMLFKGAIINSSSAINVTATENRTTKHGTTTDSYWVEAGGIAGINFWALIANSYATGNVTGDFYDENNTDHSADVTWLAAGGLTGLELGTEINNYVTGNVTALHATHYLGSIDGLGEGKGQLYNNWYSNDIVLKNGDTVCTPNADNVYVKPADDIVYAADNNGFTNISELAIPLNETITKLPVDISQYGVASTELTGWVYDANKGLVIHKSPSSQTQEASDFPSPTSENGQPSAQTETQTTHAQLQTEQIAGTEANKTISTSDQNTSSTNTQQPATKQTTQVKDKSVTLKKVTITKAKRNSKTISIKWKKVTHATGYKLAIRKKSGAWKTYHVTGTSKKLKNVSGNFSVRVRAYNKNSDTYGKWSKTVKVK